MCKNIGTIFTQEHTQNNTYTPTNMKSLTQPHVHPQTHTQRTHACPSDKMGIEFKKEATSTVLLIL